MVLFSRIRTSLNIGKLKHSDYVIPEVEAWVVPLKKGISSHSTTHLTSPFFGDGRGNSKWEYYAATAVARPSTRPISTNFVLPTIRDSIVRGDLTIWDDLKSF